MTWIAEQPTFVTTFDLTGVDAAAMALLIVDEVREPETKSRHAIGPDPGFWVHVIPPTHSRELKQAIARGALVAVGPIRDG